MATNSGSSSAPHVPTTPDKMTSDPAYIKTATTLIQNISKSHAEWTKRSREFQLTLTKSKNNKNTADSELEKLLVATIAKGDKDNEKLRAMEEKYVLNQVITQEEQSECRLAMSRMINAAKQGQKTKLN